MYPVDPKGQPSVTSPDLDLFSILSNLASAVDSIQRQNESRINHMKEIDRAFSADLLRVQNLTNLSSQFDAKLDEHLKAKDEQKEALNKKIESSGKQIEDCKALQGHVESLHDYVENRILEGTELLNELSQLNETERSKKLTTLLTELSQQEDFRLDLSENFGGPATQGNDGFKVVKLQYMGNGIGDVKQRRNIAIVASLVFLVGSVCLLPLATGPAAFGVGAALPGFQYAAFKSENSGPKVFDGWKFLRHVAAGAITHVVISKGAALVLNKLGQIFKGADCFAGAAAAIKAHHFVDITADVMGKAVSQAVLNAVGTLLRKKILQENVSSNDVVYALAAGSCGAAASYGIEKYSFEIENVIGRVFAKGIAGFVQQAAAYCGGNAVRKEGKWNALFWKETLDEGLEGFFWALVYQVADEIKQNRLNAQQFQSFKNEVCNKIDSDKSLNKNQKRELKAKIQAANTIAEINTILNEAKLQIQLAAIDKKNISPAAKKKQKDALKKKSPGVNPIIKNIYLDRFKNVKLPKDLKDKLLEDIEKCTSPEEINQVINDAMKAINNEIQLASLEGKTWEEAKGIVKKWILELAEAGYHPSGDHYKQDAYKNDLIVDALAVKILKGEQIKWTHHHHNQLIIKDGNNLKKIRDGVVVEERQFDKDIIEPKRDIAALRERYQVIKNVKKDCELEAHAELKEHQESAKILKEPFDHVKAEALAKLNPEQRQSVNKAFGNHVAAMNAQPNIPPAAAPREPQAVAPQAQSNPKPIKVDVPQFNVRPTPIDPSMAPALQPTNLPFIQNPVDPLKGAKPIVPKNPTPYGAVIPPAQAKEVEPRNIIPNPALIAAVQDKPVEPMNVIPNVLEAAAIQPFQVEPLIEVLRALEAAANPLLAEPRNQVPRALEGAPIQAQVPQLPINVLLNNQPARPPRPPAPPVLREGGLYARMPKLPLGAVLIKWQRDVELLRDQIAACPNTRAGRARKLYLQKQLPR